MSNSKERLEELVKELTGASGTLEAMDGKPSLQLSLLVGYRGLVHESVDLLAGYGDMFASATEASEKARKRPGSDGSYKLALVPSVALPIVALVADKGIKAHGACPVCTCLTDGTSFDVAASEAASKAAKTPLGAPSIDVAALAGDWQGSNPFDAHMPSKAKHSGDRSGASQMPLPDGEVKISAAFRGTRYTGMVKADSEGRQAIYIDNVPRGAEQFGGAGPHYSRSAAGNAISMAVASAEPDALPPDEIKEKRRVRGTTFWKLAGTATYL